MPPESARGTTSRHNTDIVSRGPVVPTADNVGIVLYRLCHFTFIPQLEGLLLLAKNKKKSENSALCGQIFRFASLQAIARLDAFISNARYLSLADEPSAAVSAFAVLPASPEIRWTICADNLQKS